MLLSVALAAALSQTPVADKAAPAIHLRAEQPKTSACPLNGSIEASDPAIARPGIDSGPRGGFPDMVHLPPTVLMATLNRTINGCFAPLILAADVTVVQSKPKAAPKLDAAPKPSGPGVR